MSEKYDLVVIGGGPGGLAAAEIAAAKKKRALIIEKDGWGGTCTHKGCIPTKALLTCSKFYTDLKKLKRVGVNILSATVDFAAMKRHQQQIVKVAALGAQKVLTDRWKQNWARAKLSRRRKCDTLINPGRVNRLRRITLLLPGVRSRKS